MDTNSEPRKLIAELSDKYGGVEKWPVLCQAEALLCTISALHGQLSVEGMWIRELSEICYYLAEIPNSGITRTSYDTHEDNRGEDEWHDWVYQYGEHAIHIHNYQYYSRAHFGDEDWSLVVN